MAAKKENKHYYSILQWIVEQDLRNEKGEPFDFKDRPFLLDILTDFNPRLAVVACAQVGKSVTFILKVLFAVKYLRFNVIYTFPSDDDVKEFVSSKVNKILQSNSQEFEGMATDNIERKELNDRFIFFKGTISKTAAISTTADLRVHDETSRSDQNAIVTYGSRTKASQFKGSWQFSNPGVERDTLDLEWNISDQKEWIIKCPTCNEEQMLTFPDSINLEKKHYQCTVCKAELEDDVRRKGKWVKQNPESKISGYHISHLMCCWISAEEIIEDSQGDPAYFNNFVLGKPYSPGDLSVTKQTILDLWTPRDLTTGKIFIGIDVGNIKHYVIRSEKGILKLGRFSKWEELDDLIKFWKPTAGVIDAMPDNTASKHYVDTYPWMNMSFFQENNNNPQTIVWWGEGDKKGIVYSHRDRILDRMLTDMIEAKFLIGVQSDKNFQDFIKHFETLRRAKVVNNKGIERYCFVEGTQIVTEHGNKNIEDVQEGDRVLTRDGFKRVSATMNRLADVITKGNLCGTPDHPVFTNKGVQPLLSIPLYDKVYLWQAKKSFITILRFIDTLNQKALQTEITLDQHVSTEKWELKDYIRRYTKIILETYQMVLLSITKTIILLTIRQITWKSYLKKNTIGITLENFSQIQNGQKRDLPQRQKKNGWEDLTSGKKLLVLKSFLRNMAKKTLILRKLNTLYAWNVKSHVPVITKELESIVVKSVETSITIDSTGQNKRVYNLTVEDTPEYFANGVLVHNCWDSTTGVDHYVFACLYAYLAMQGDGAGVFFGEETEKTSVIDVDNNYDLSRNWRDNQDF